MGRWGGGSEWGWGGRVWEFGADKPAVACSRWRKRGVICWLLACFAAPSLQCVDKTPAEVQRSSAEAVVQLLKSLQ